MAEKNENLDEKRKRLYYQSWYRGTKETDLILGPFAREHLPAMTAAELEAYHLFLNESDTDIYAWVTGQAAAPDFIDAGILQKLRDFWGSKAA